MAAENKIIICRYGEIHLKGGNRALFIKALLNQIRRRVRAKAEMTDTRIVVSGFADADETVGQLQTVFGLTGISVGERMEYKTPADILSRVAALRVTGRFKVEVNRADKNFPIKSPQFAADCGETILKNNADAVVDVREPRTTVTVDIRNNGTVFIFDGAVSGLGGLPVGVSGRALCLISGGIDSPVAAFMAAKRGMAVDFVHFASPPYTSGQALDKVKDLCGAVCRFSGRGNLFVVPFTEIQTEIRKHCREEFMITIMRRFMIELAEKIGIANHADCLITGENLAQVASQTIQGITTNNFVAKQLPILRPLICFDKAEIISMAKQIKTYETSILPYADCCTVFVPKHPSIKPQIAEVERECERLPIAKLVDLAYSEVCKLQIGCGE